MGQGEADGTAKEGLCASKKLLKEVVLRCFDECCNLKNKLNFDPKIFTRKLIKYWLYNEDATDYPPVDSAFGSYVFLLQKNISVTNLPMPEQVALLRRHASELDNRPLPQSGLNFFSTRQYRRYVERFLPNNIRKFSSESAANKYRSDLCDSLLEYYSDFFLSTIALSNYSTSFVVHIPRTFRFNLIKIVGEAGYVHSVGYQVYVSVADYSDRSVLLDKLHRFVSIKNSDKPIYFAPYCHEYFSGEAEMTSYSMENGLDEVKISARKHFIGKTNLLDFVSELAKEEEFMVPNSDKFDTEKEAVDDRVDQDTTIFLFLDSGLEYSQTSRTLRKGESIYVICYAQLLKFANKFHFIKERKPGWTAPVTIPHTLSAAMVNIAGSLLPLPVRKGAPVIFDPFCGSSTFLVDAAIRFPQASLVGVDRHPLFHCINKDNFQNLSMPSGAGQLRDLANSLLPELKKSSTATDVLHRLNSLTTDQSINELYPPGSDKLAVFCTAITLLLKELCECTDSSIQEISSYEVGLFREDDSHFSQKLVTTLEAWEAENGRVAFYFAWRALSNFSFRIKAKPSALDWVTFFNSEILPAELTRVALEFGDISKIDAAETTENNTLLNTGNRFELVSGLFSDEVRISNQYLIDTFGEGSVDYTTPERFLSGISTGQEVKKVRLVKGDSLSFIEDLLRENKEERKFRPNLIITDPPYSFNVSEGNEAMMQDLFFKTVDYIPRLLAKRGVASIVVPSFSRNGRSIPFYQSNEVFTRRMMTACARAGREIILSSESVPNSVTFPKLPYVWNSQRGVSRHVMNFFDRLNNR